MDIETLMPGGLDALRRVRPPSLGLPLTFFPPGGRPHASAERLEKDHGNGRPPGLGRLDQKPARAPGQSSAPGAVVRTSGAPGKDRAGGKGKKAERQQPQGFTQRLGNADDPGSPDGGF